MKSKQLDKADKILYEECLIDTAIRLKKRGFDNYQEMATNMCRTRVNEGEFAERSFALDIT